VEGGALRVAQVVEHGATSGDGGVAARETAAVERVQFEVLAQNAVRVIGAEDPVFELGDDPAFWLRLRKLFEKTRPFGRDQNFAGSDAFDQAGEVGKF